MGGSHVKRSYAALSGAGLLVCYGFTKAELESVCAATRRCMPCMPSCTCHIAAPAPTPADTNRALAAMATFGAIAAYQSRCCTGRNATFFGVVLRKESHPAEFRSDMLKVMALLHDGKLRPLVAARLPLEAAKPALEYVNGLAHTGKLVLIVDAALAEVERRAGRLTSADDLAGGRLKPTGGPVPAVAAPTSVGVAVGAGAGAGAGVGAGAGTSAAAAAGEAATAPIGDVGAGAGAAPGAAGTGLA